MKRILKKLALWTVVIVLIAAGFGLAFRTKLMNAFQRHMRRETKVSIVKYGAGLPAVDEVRLLRLDYESNGTALGTYKVPFSDPSKRFIVAERTLTGKDAQDVASQWRALKLHTDYMAMCYEPHHVVQFRANGSTLCEAVICFMCGNTSLPAFPMKTMVDFESIPKSESPEYLKFRATIEGFVGAGPP